VVIEGQMMVFGGYKKGGDVVAELWQFDLIGDRWTQITPVASPGRRVPRWPPARHSHAAVGVGCRMFVFGGSTTRNHKLNDIWSFNTETHTWAEIETSGEKPSPRADLCGVMHGQLLIIVGGTDMDNEDSTDIYTLGLQTQEWRCKQRSRPAKDQKSSTGASDAPLKASASRVTADGHRIKVSSHRISAHKLAATRQSTGTMIGLDDTQRSVGGAGGLSPPDIDGLLFKALKSLAPAPFLRARAPDCVREVDQPHPEGQGVGDFVRRMASRFGRQGGSGARDSKRGNEARLLDAAGNLRRKTATKHEGRVPCPRSGHTMVLHEGALYIFGGDRHRTKLNDTFILRL